MPAKERFKTNYPGVYFIESIAVGTGKPERVYYILYRKGGKLIEEKAGRQFQDDMTPARAARIRAQRIEGKELSNQARREALEAEKQALAGRWTLTRLWGEYKAQKPPSKAVRTDDSRFSLYLAPSFGGKEPSEIITLDVARLKSSLLKTKSPPNSQACSRSP